MNIEQLLNKIKTNPDCVVYPPTGIPSVEEKNKLPLDVTDFYTLCGGLSLFESESYSLRFVSPQEVVPANPKIIGEEVIREEKAKGSYDSQISKDWYIIVDLCNSDYIAIDFNQNRTGLCYKAFWDTYPCVGDTPIIASTFTELLMKLIENKGQYWYFLEEDFIPLGDAYDSIEDS